MVALPLVLVLTAVGTLITEAFDGNTAARKCTAETYKSLILGDKNTCFSTHPAAIGVPVYVDSLSLLGASAALGIVILYIRLSRLMLHVPFNRKGQHQRNGHQDALSSNSHHRLGLLRGRWLIEETRRERKRRRRANNRAGSTSEGAPNSGSGPDSARVETISSSRGVVADAGEPGTGLRLGILLAALVVSILAYVLYYVHGEEFSRICGSNFRIGSGQRCEDVARARWWANWRTHPYYAVAWILVTGLAISLGLDNFVTTSDFTKKVARALSHKSGRLPTLPFIENFDHVQTSWTFLQGFLAELRLGFFPTIAMLLTVLGVVGDVGDAHTTFVVQSFEVPLVLLFVGFFFGRLNSFQAAVRTRAEQTVVVEFDKINAQLTEARRGENDADIARLQDQLNWLTERGVLPPVAVDQRLRAYVGYVAGLAGLVIALLTLLRT